MRTHFIIGFVIWMLLFSLSPSSKAQQEEDHNLFIYSQGNQDVGWFIGWRSIREETLSGQVSIPGPPTAFATPLLGNYFSVVVANDVYLIDISKGSLTPLNVTILHKEGFAYDIEYIRARSMRWSPDGTMLAFVGQTAPDRADIYLYDTTLDEIINMTSDIAFTSDLLNLGGWSPDGMWISIVGQWQRNPEIPWMTGGIISLDGENFVELNPDDPVCKLIWSPTQQYLISATDCPSYPTAQPGTDLIIFSLITSDSEIQVSDPLHFNDLTDDAWYYYYPKWSDATTFATMRLSAQPVVNGSLSPRIELIEYNILNRQLTTIPTNMPLQFLTHGIQFGERVIWQDISGDVKVIYSTDISTGNSLTIPVDYPDICSLLHVRISLDAAYLAFVAGCQQDIILSKVVVWDIQQGSDVFTISQSNTDTTSLGWMSTLKNGS